MMNYSAVGSVVGRGEGVGDDETAHGWGGKGGRPDARVRASPRPVWKTSEVVAFAVVRDIVEHGLHSGDRLPLEAEMVEQYGVSRESLREALRLLEAQGIVSIRRGPGGGPVVGRASSMNLARTMTLYFQLAGATYEELLEAWRMLEPLAAELAARNPDRDWWRRHARRPRRAVRRPR